MGISEIDSGRIIEINDYFCSVLEYNRSEVIGETSTSLDIMRSEDRSVMIKGLVSAGSIKGYETELYKKGGAPVFCRIYGEKINISGEEKLLTIIEDITEKKKAEREIQSLLEQKEMLLREVHHRIKNNMNTIAGLLKLQSLSTSDSRIVDALNDARGRVQNMMIIYDRLYRSDDYTNLSVKKYFENLIDEIVKIFPNYSSVKVTKIIDDFTLDSKILFTAGIMINELITNAFKYAFDGIDRPEIIFSLFRNENTVKVSVKDNGRGISENLLNGPGDGFGLNLVSSLAEQLEGEMRILKDPGTEITVTFLL